MTVSITPVDVSSPGDGLGDDAYTAFSAINTNEAAIKAAIEAMQGRLWTVRNTTLSPLVMGARYMADNHAGITFTMPGTFAVSATAESDIWVANTDDASNVTLTPASGDAFFVDGATLGADTTKALTPGQLAMISPRTTDSEWDVLILNSGGGWADMTEAVWAGGSQSEVADGASAIAFDLDTDNTYSTSGAKLLSLKNNTTEEFSVTYDGEVRASRFVTEVDGGMPVEIGTNIVGLSRNGSVGGLQLHGASASQPTAWVSGTDVRIRNGDQFSWTSHATLPTGGADTGFKRSAAGIVKITDGSTGLGSYTAKSGEYDLTTEDAAFINFKATADADATSAISTLTTSGSVSGHIQISVNGTTAWIPYSTTDPS
jgi:hypothetical protein